MFFIGLELGHEYVIDVLAINQLGETWDEQKFSAKTAGNTDACIKLSWSGCLNVNTV